MSDPRFDLWARTLVNYSVTDGVKPGDCVAIGGGSAAEPLLRAIYRETIVAGGFPVLMPSLSGLVADLLQYGNDDQIQFISPIEEFAREQADVLINVMAETNTKALSAVDPARQSLLAKARGRLLETMLRRDAAGELRWTLTLFPTNAYAQDADMSTPDFTEFVLAACKLDLPDPAAAWRAQAAEQQRL
ncbi:MAG TPA: aminopeptidase, partial [Thermomicrobiales bacterium]|nr:aminopeptidase [Thermomicrobiales bacterium]